MKRRGRPPYPDILTPREQEVQALLREGLTNEQIASRLNISANAAKYHVSEILSKLGVSSRYEAATWQPGQRPWWLSALAVVGWPLARLKAMTLPAGLKTALAGATTVVVVGGLTAGIVLAARYAASQADDDQQAATDVSGPNAGGMGTIAYVQDRDIWVSNPSGGQQSRITTDGNIANFSWSPDGRLVFRSSANGPPSLYVINRDSTGLTQLSVTGSSFLPAWSPDGQRIAFLTTQGGRWGLSIIRPDGTGLTHLADVGPVENAFPPAWSPDGQRIAFESEEAGNVDIFVINVDGSDLRNITNNPSYDAGPSWSADGTRLTFISERDGDSEIYTMNRDGTDVQKLTDNSAVDISATWAPDGELIAFASDRDGNFEIYVMGSNGSNQTNLSNDPASDFAAVPVGHFALSWSSDSEQIAFVSDRDGNLEVYTAAADGSGVTRVTDHPSNNTWPAWTSAEVAQPTVEPTPSAPVAQATFVERDQAPVSLDASAIGPDSPEARLTVDPESGRYEQMPPIDGYVPESLTINGRYVLVSSASQVGEASELAVLDIVNGTATNIGPGWAGEVSPDGRWAAIIPDIEGSTLAVMDVQTGQRYALGEFGKPVHLSWSPDNRLVLVKDGMLYKAQSPDWTPTQVITFPYTRPEWSPDSAWLAYAERGEIKIVNSGPTTTIRTVVPLSVAPGDPGFYRVGTLQWALDGERLAYGTDEGAFVVSLSTGVITNVLSTSVMPSSLFWSPGGSQIALYISDDQRQGIVIANADGSGAYQLTEGVAQILGWTDEGIIAYVCHCP